MDKLIRGIYPDEQPSGHFVLIIGPRTQTPSRGEQRKERINSPRLLASIDLLAHDANSSYTGCLMVEVLFASAPSET